MAEKNERLAFEKIEKFATLMSFFPKVHKNTELFDIGANHVRIKMTDEEGDMYEFTFTSSKG